MANKAVLGAVALAGAGYAATEQFKEWRVKKEQEEREQLDRDRREEYLRRMEESRRKKGKRYIKRNGPGNDTVGDGGVPIELFFQQLVYSKVEDILFDLLVKVGEEGQPLRNPDNLPHLNLPLMGNEYEKEDLMLAAAFALGEEDLVGKVAALFTKQKLGLGLKKFTSKSIRHIIRVFRTFKDPGISYHVLNLFVQMGVYTPDFRSSNGPILRVISNKYSYSDLLRQVGKEYGFHITHTSCLKMSSPRSKMSHKKNIKFTFDKPTQVGRNEASYSSSASSNGGEVIIRNFHCDFEAAVICFDGYAQPDFDRISLIGPQKFHNRISPDVDAIANAFARKIAAGMTEIASKRLTSLLRWNMIDRGINQGLSHEHMAVYSGNNSSLLRMLAESDSEMINQNKEKISATLHETLKMSVPSPEDDVIGERGSQSDGLNREISKFVDSYLSLINLSYCAIPLVFGNPPSSFVPEFSVNGEALRDSIWEPNPVMVHSTRRLLEKEERERVRLSRKVVAPGKAFSLAFMISLWILSSWLCLITTHKVLLQFIYPRHGYYFRLIMSQGFVWWMLHSLVEISKKLFRLSDEDSCWDVASCCTEYTFRTLARKLGNPTPYDQEMARLRETCRMQYRQWKLRIAKRDFYIALKRKRITNRECVLLLTEFAHYYVENEGEEIIEGVFPVTLDEAEQFLKLKVEEQAPCNEINLSSSESLKMYLSSGSQGPIRSSIEELNGLSSKVEQFVHFSEGARVIVEMEENDEFDWQNVDDDSDPKYSEIVCKRSRTGSVAFCTATLCFVHFDGLPVSFPTPIPIKYCSILDEHPFGESKGEETSQLKGESVVEHSVDEESDEVMIDQSNLPSENLSGSQAKERARTVEEALIQGGWKLKRAKKHVKYSRRVKLASGETREENVTLSKTPSDWRAAMNALALLRRLNDEVEELFHRSPLQMVSKMQSCAFAVSARCRSQ